jgi:hypothetical protein
MMFSFSVLRVNSLKEKKTRFVTTKKVSVPGELILSRKAFVSLLEQTGSLVQVQKHMMMLVVMRIGDSEFMAAYDLEPRFLVKINRSCISHPGK